MSGWDKTTSTGISLDLNSSFQLGSYGSGGTVGGAYVSGPAISHINTSGGTVGSTTLLPSDAHRLATEGGMLNGSIITAHEAQRMGFK